MNSDFPSTTVSTSLPAVVVQGEFSDFDTLADVAKGWGLDWRQLDRGPLRATMQQVGMPSLQLSRFSFSRKFHQRGTTPPGVRTLGIIGERSPDVEWRGRVGTRNYIVVFPTRDEFEFVSQPDFHGDTVSVPDERLRAVAETLGLPDPLETLPQGQDFFPADPRRVSVLRRRLTGLHSLVHGDPPSGNSARSEVEFDVIAALVGALGTSLGTARRAPEPALRSRALRLALEYIEAYADQPPTIGDLCAASAASARTLEYAFRDWFGVTPKQYLQATRLHRVRRDLRRFGGHASVSEIAARWGFWHMGQFAADYRRQFGELPSETLRRASRA
jgi:AraC family ethanolamine operon transcriptional activator